MKTEMKATVVCGDVNIDMKKIGAEQRSLNNYLEEAGLKLMVETSTHEKGGLIDHLYVSKELVNNTKVKQKGISFSDHDLMLIQIKVDS